MKQCCYSSGTMRGTVLQNLPRLPIAFWVPVWCTQSVHEFRRIMFTTVNNLWKCLYRGHTEPQNFEVNHAVLENIPSTWKDLWCHGQSKPPPTQFRLRSLPFSAAYLVPYQRGFLQTHVTICQPPHTHTILIPSWGVVGTEPKLILLEVNRVYPIVRSESGLGLSSGLGQTVKKTSTKYDFRGKFM